MSLTSIFNENRFSVTVIAVALFCILQCPGSDARPQKLDNVDNSVVVGADQAELERIQNESAQYAFNARVEDQINDGAIQREEVRDGSKVTGMYSYSDGFVMRTVYYEADENGYRVVKEDTQEIGDGPQFNADGQADVEGSLIGKYSIKLDKDDQEKHYKEVNAS